MTMPYDLMGGLAPTPPGTGVLAQPQTITTPIQNPLSPGFSFDAMADQRAKMNALKQQLLRAAVLRDEPLNAKGAGPLGARQGVGPMGWAVTLGDVVAGIIGKNKRAKSAEDTIKAMGDLSPSEQALAKNYLENSPGGIYGSGYGMANAAGQPKPPYVPDMPPFSY